MEMGAKTNYIFNRSYACTHAHTHAYNSNQIPNVPIGANFGISNRTFLQKSHYGPMKMRCFEC